MKTWLIGSVHGTIEGATTVVEAKRKLIDKFSVRLAPTACEADRAKRAIYHKIRKNDRTTYRKAYMSSKTFTSEVAADAIVQPVAINAFISGLNNNQIAFFVKARNPPNLNRAISDALEVVPINKEVV